MIKDCQYISTEARDLETGCLKLAIVKFLGVHILRDNILRFQP